MFSLTVDIYQQNTVHTSQVEPLVNVASAAFQVHTWQVLMGYQHRVSANEAHFV